MILDTNAISALASNEIGVRKEIQSLHRIAVTLISIAEFQYGIEGSTHREALQNWLDAFLEHAEVLSPTLQTVHHYASIRNALKQNGTPIPANDVWIAALCQQFQMPILSRDHHFDFVEGVKRIGW